jgi:glycosyltransferase involved in cell wall biosynthesis
MATYNRGRHVLPSIQSVMQQSFQDFELLIVGDQCTDDTEAVISPFLSEKVRWSNQSEHSCSQSSPNNAGIELAKGANIAYIGHDDIWSKDHLASLMALFTAETGLHFAISGAIYHMPPGVERPQVTGIFDDQSAKFSHFFPPSSFAHRRDVIAKTGGWRDPAEIKPPVDAELLLRAAHAGFRFASTKKITVHKFAAGHRYLSGLRHTSHEQEDMLRRMREPDFDKYIENLVDRSREVGSYMVVRYFDFEQYEPGQLARENAARKGALRPPLRPLKFREVVPQESFALAWDWNERLPEGLRWVGLNPRPKLLLPFTADKPAAVQLIVAHERAEALERLTLSGGGSVFSASIGPAFRVADHWEAVASFKVELASNDYTILELHLEGPQIAKPEVRGIGIGEISIDPLPQSLAPGGVAEELYFAARIKAVEATDHLQAELSAMITDRARLSSETQRLQAELVAINESTSWRITKPLRRSKEFIRSIRRRVLRGRVSEQRKL